MARRTSTTFTEVELEFMHVIWNQKEVSTENIQNALREKGHELSDGSIRKILSILMRKGHLKRRRVGRGFLYRAKEQKDQAHKNIVQDILRRAFEGSATLMVAALLDSKDVNKNDIEEIKRLIQNHEES